MAFTEFCCRSGGSNLNAGTRTGNSTEPGTSADFTYASGSWVSSTGVFTVASGNPSTDGVAVGDFASVYADGASVTTLVGRVTAVSSTTVTVSTTAKTGTTTDGTSNRTLRIGGAWQGPNGASGFPLNFLTNACTNSSGDLPRINYKNAATYSITANITGVGADTTHQGYATSYGDLGKATLDGGTSGASYNLIGITVGANANLIDFICQNNGATGSSSGVFWNGNGQVVRCVFHDFRGAGLQTNNSTAIVECEAYNCNQSNTSGLAGFVVAAQSLFLRCISHDNSGSNSNGYYTNGAMSQFIDCIADTNGARGFQIEANAIRLINCDAYGNGSDGVRFANGGTNMNITVENCNFTKNGGWGFLGNGAGKMTGRIQNCGYGAGTEANTSGTSSTLGSIVESGSVTYASNSSPYSDPANGDFRISLAEAKSAGRGSFTQTAASYTGTVGYPDIGAAQAQATASGGGVRSVNIRGGADQ